jgi:photosystem II stability/assembly factor-like uncharacterized protein
MASPKVGFFFANEQLYKTNDGTASWKRIRDLPMPGGLLTGAMRRHHVNINSIDASDTGDVLALGGSLGDWVKGCEAEGTLASVWTSHNRGKTWFRTTLPISGAVHDVTFFDDLHGVAIAYEFKEVQRDDGFCLESFRDVVLYTDDGGRTYDEVKYCSHGANGNACTAVGMSTARKFVVGTSTGLTYRTTNRGRTFRKGPLLHEGMPSVEEQDRWYWVEGIDFANSKIGFASTNGGSTWKTRNGGRNWIEEPSTERVWGYLKFGDIAVADADRAVSAGSAFVITRTGVPEP